jgi:hypothetical protein
MGEPSPLPTSFLDELRAATTLSHLVGRTLKLQRAGRDWKACCPFHDESTPSFYVNDQKRFYHCFGCGAHGDAIQWLCNARKLPLTEAIKELAVVAGMEVPANADVQQGEQGVHDRVASEVILGRKGGGKLNRSETVTVRLDPKLNYLCELAARAQRRTKSSFIEWAIADSLASVSLPEADALGYDRAHEVTIGGKASRLWHVDEADRIVALALIAPALLTHEEQLIWRLVRENGYLWRGGYNKQNEWTWEVSEEKLIRDRLRDTWDTFKAVAAGNLPKTHLPNWQKSRDLLLDDDVPF